MVVTQTTQTKDSMAEKKRGLFAETALVTDDMSVEIVYISDFWQGSETRVK